MIFTDCGALPDDSLCPISECREHAGTFGMHVSLVLRASTVLSNAKYATEK